MEKFDIDHLPRRAAEHLMGRRGLASGSIPTVGSDSQAIDRDPIVEISLDIRDTYLLFGKLGIVLKGLLPGELVEITRGPLLAGTEGILREDLIPNESGGLSVEGVQSTGWQRVLDTICFGPKVTLTTGSIVPLKDIIRVLESLAPTFERPVDECLNRTVSGWTLEKGLNPALLGCQGRWASSASKIPNI